MTDTAAGATIQLYWELLHVCQQAPGATITATTREHLRAAVASMTQTDPGPEGRHALPARARWTMVDTPDWSGQVLHQGPRRTGYVQRVPTAGQADRWRPLDGDGQALASTPIVSDARAREAVQRHTAIADDMIDYDPRIRAMATARVA
ncbi:MAG TPA: hypothetical protein VJT31_26270 [Rugosimonospora sp.]|nr:hypothetical protein [Rugosimonospora sp.]